jgi:hypothetical protein
MDTELFTTWFTSRIPADWFVGPVELTVDREEILVVGQLPAPEAGEAAAAEELTRIRTHREHTRAGRIAIAEEAEATFARKVAWGARCGDRSEVFTSIAVPVMTRLRLPERRVLDTLIDASVARSRSEALAWCVRLVGRNQSEWIDQLRAAMADVAKAREAGPDV